MSFVGLRIAGTVGALSMLGALCAAVITYGLEELDRSAITGMEADVEARVEAGKMAIASILQADEEQTKLQTALERAHRLAASARARELVRLAAGGELSGISLSSNESLTLVR